MSGTEEKKEREGIKRVKRKSESNSTLMYVKKD